MAVHAHCRQGHFAPKGTTGQQTIGGMLFSPKAIVFWWAPETDEVDATVAPAHLCLGAATGASHRWALAYRVTSSPDVEANLHADACLASVGGHGQADLHSLASDGFTIDWSDAGDPAAVVYYLALGGADLDARAGVINHDGSTVVSGIGVSPTALVLAASRSFGEPDLSVGFCDDTLEQRCAVSGAYVSGGRLHTNGGGSPRGAVQQTAGAAGGSESVHAVTAIGASGFTLSRISGAADTFDVAYLALGGIPASVGDFGISGPSTFVNDLAGAVNAALFTSAPFSRDGSSVSPQPVMFGGCDRQMQQGAVAATWRLNGAPAARSRRAARGTLWFSDQESNEWADVYYEGTLTGWDADGFTFVNPYGGGMLVGYLAFGDAEAPPRGRGTLTGEHPKAGGA